MNQTLRWMLILVFDLLIKIIVLLGATVCAVIDQRTRRIPNAITLPMAIIGLILNYLAGGWNQTGSSLMGLGVGFAVMILPQLLTHKLAKNPMGGGDVKLIGAIGALLGPVSVVIVWLYFSILYGLLSIFIRVKYKGSKGHTAALGPYIAVGALLAILLEKPTRAFMGF